MDIKTTMIGSDTIIVTENADGILYMLSAKYINDLICGWHENCDYVPASDARVLATAKP